MGAEGKCRSDPILLCFVEYKFRGAGIEEQFALLTGNDRLKRRQMAKVLRFHPSRQFVFFLIELANELKVFAVVIHHPFKVDELSETDQTVEFHLILLLNMLHIHGENFTRAKAPFAKGKAFNLGLEGHWGSGGTNPRIAFFRSFVIYIAGIEDDVLGAGIEEKEATFAVKVAPEKRGIAIKFHRNGHLFRDQNLVTSCHGML